jgi:hypothetical protein
MSHKFDTGELGGILSTSSFVVAFLKFQIPIPKSQGKLNRQIEKDRVVCQYLPLGPWDLEPAVPISSLSVFICVIRGQTDLRLSLAGKISNFCLDRLTSFSQTRRRYRYIDLKRAEEIYPARLFASFRPTTPTQREKKERTHP